MNQFYQDILQGLLATPKYLPSKYFYDAEGDIIFQQIMHSPEYYLTNCELEILQHQTEALVQVFKEQLNTYDLVELGAGDASKTSYLLKHLVNTTTAFTYYPIDISQHVIALLETELPSAIPGLLVTGLNGEYFDMLEKANQLSKKNKVVLFLGSNIGNMFPEKCLEFCRHLYQMLLPGDILVMGVDLKKHPQTILSAYNDRQGFTRNFNLNLLNRINRELGADFNLANFDHYPTYDPETGSCKSYLISLKDQQITLSKTKDVIQLAANEPIFMEVSHKYSPEEIENIAHITGFTPIAQFYDSKHWFTDVIWQR
ncbi:L-histidine N(alpha)-methyltransferase [Adhaeribacter aquaticus]|uniref:L-histidine N(alpha)-methyltransferase n=1 Tax=Adhaeribacter aquaticus TaxID=299567 RepID=UPI0004028A49|nr:L-histidine N(alpha)-methyltransferase [Adhaeribacter aquaticus]